MDSILFKQGSAILGCAAVVFALANAESGLASYHFAQSKQVDLSQVLDVSRANTKPLAQNPDISQITEIQIAPAEQGFNLVIETAQGEALEGALSTLGNNLVIDIPNAQLRDGPFLQANPSAGIASIEAIAPAANQVQIRITGIDAAPIGEIVASQRGLILGITPPMIVGVPEPIRIVVTMTMALSRGWQEVTMSTEISMLGRKDSLLAQTSAVQQLA